MDVFFFCGLKKILCLGVVILMPFATFFEAKKLNKIIVPPSDMLRRFLPKHLSALKIKHSKIGFSTSLYFTASEFGKSSKIQSLFKEKDTEGCLQEFKKNPNSNDAVFLINQTEISFEHCIQIYDLVRNELRALVAIINTSHRRNKLKEMKELTQELIMTLKDHVDTAKHGDVSEKTWNMIIVCLSRDSKFEEDTIYWFNHFLKQQGQPNVFSLNVMLKLFSKKGWDEMSRNGSNVEKSGRMQHVTLLLACSIFYHFWRFDG